LKQLITKVVPPPVRKRLVTKVPTTDAVGADTKRIKEFFMKPQAG